MEPLRYVRTCEDVASVIQHAKLSESELRPTTQTLYFADDFPELKLIELDAHLLSKLELGEEFRIRGRKDDRAVLCSEESTFDLKIAETSNSLLLVPGLEYSDDLPQKSNERILQKRNVVGVFGEYFEIKKIKPKLQRLTSLLKLYRGSELEEEVQTAVEGYYTEEELLENVQASRQELRDCLKEIGALCINGKWRLLDDEYHFRALNFFLNLIEERDWPCYEIPLGETITTLKELLPEVILNHMLENYLLPTGDYSDDGEEFFKLDEFKTCRFIGETLLKPADKFNLDDFLEAWQQIVPQGLKTDLKQLDGLALHSVDTRPLTIWYYPESRLSADPTERFAQLFEERPKWTYEHIEPYIKNLATDKLTVNALLTRHTRACHVGGTKIYCARHGN